MRLKRILGVGQCIYLTSWHNVIPFDSRGIWLLSTSRIELHPDLLPEKGSNNRAIVLLIHVRYHISLKAGFPRKAAD